MNIKLQTNEQLSATVANGLAGVFINGVSLSTSLSGKADLTALQNCYTKSETSSAGELSTAFENAGGKVYFDNRISGITGSNDLSVVKLSAAEYAYMLDEGTCLSNALYIVETPTVNAFKQRIINVAPGTGLSDAVNLEQLNNAISTYAGECLPLSGGTMSGSISCGDAIGVDFNGVQVTNGEQSNGFAVYVSGIAKYAFYDTANGNLPSAMPPQGNTDFNIMRGMDVYAVLGDISSLIHAI